MNFGRFITNFSLLGLAASIAYLGYTLNSYTPLVNKTIETVDVYAVQLEEFNNQMRYFNVIGTDFVSQIPSMKTSLNGTSSSLNRLSAQMHSFQEQAVLFQNEMEAFRIQAQSFETELSLFREQGESFQEELKLYRKMTPAVLASLDDSTKQIETLNGYVPEALKLSEDLSTTISKASENLTEASKMADTFQPTIDGLSGEVRQFRQEVPYYLADLRDIVNEANQVGEKASEGIVGGFLKGIVTSPIQLLKSTTKSLKTTFGKGAKITEEDQSLISMKIQSALHSGEKSFWVNKESGNKGSVEPSDVYSRYGRECRTLNIEVSLNDGQSDVSTLEMCRSSNPDIWIQI